MSAEPCAQEKCPHGHPPAVWRFTWPGSPSQVVCDRCGKWAHTIAENLGFVLKLDSTATGLEAGDGSRFDKIEVD